MILGLTKLDIYCGNIPLNRRKYQNQGIYNNIFALVTALMLNIADHHTFYWRLHLRLFLRRTHWLTAISKHVFKNVVYFLKFVTYPPLSRPFGSFVFRVLVMPSTKRLQYLKCGNTYALYRFIMMCFGTKCLRLLPTFRRRKKSVF